METGNSSRHYTPKELSAKLSEKGISLSVRSIVWRCRLPAGEALRIATNPNYPGRHYVPAGELARLLGVSEGVS